MVPAHAQSNAINLNFQGLIFINLTPLCYSVRWLSMLLFSNALYAALQQRSL
jgi:hypothetical protein